MAKKKPVVEKPAIAAPTKAVVPTKAVAPTKAAAPKSTVAKAKSAIVHAVEQVAEAAKVHVITPVAEAVGIVDKPKKKKEKPVRTKTPVTEATPLPPRSKTVKGKMMSKNLALPPDETPGRGTKPKAKK